MAAPTSLTPEQRRLRAQMGAAALHARGGANTEPARRAWADRFLDEVDPDRVLPEAERQRRADAAKRAYMIGLAYKSSRARAKRTGAA